MLRWTLAIVAAFAVVAPAQAHFIFILPEGQKASIVFSDQLAPDEVVDIGKIAKIKVFAANDLMTPLHLKKAEHALVANVPAGCNFLVGTCAYGTLARGNTPPFMLYYHAKAAFGSPALAKTHARMPLELCFVSGGEGKATFKLVTADGKPCPSCEVVAMTEGAKNQTLTTNTEGLVEVALPTPGTYGLRARLIEKKAGEHEGTKYEEVRHYATLVFDTRAARDKAVKPIGQAADAEATRLLAEARAARATWKDFPGFTAKIEVNFDGSVSRGTVSVDDGGKIVLSGVEPEMQGWVKRTLGSIVGHRIDTGRSYDTPCAFGDGSTDHPLGRLITILNDEMHSSYRIKDRQIMVVNREMPDSRFSIIVQDNLLTPEKKYLSSTFVVHYWDAKTGELQRTEANLQRWTRVSGFDLPTRNQVIYGGKEVGVKSFTLSDHRLMQAK